MLCLPVVTMIVTTFCIDRYVTFTVIRGIDFIVPLHSVTPPPPHRICLAPSMLRGTLLRHFTRYWCSTMVRYSIPLPCHAIVALPYRDRWVHAFVADTVRSPLHCRTTPCLNRAGYVTVTVVTVFCTHTYRVYMPHVTCVVMPIRCLPRTSILHTALPRSVRCAADLTPAIPVLPLRHTRCCTLRLHTTFLLRYTVVRDRSEHALTFSFCTVDRVYIRCYAVLRCLLIDRRFYVTPHRSYAVHHLRYAAFVRIVLFCLIGDVTVALRAPFHGDHSCLFTIATLIRCCYVACLPMRSLHLCRYDRLPHAIVVDRFWCVAACDVRVHLSH